MIYYTDEFETLKLGDVIGQGSFGTVYKAVWKGVVVAAKDINIEEGTRGYTKLIEEVEMTRYYMYFKYRLLYLILSSHCIYTASSM